MNYCKTETPFLFNDGILVMCFGFSDFHSSDEVITMLSSLSWMIKRFQEITGLSDEEMKKCRIKQKGEYEKCEGQTILYIKANKEKEFPVEWKCDKKFWEVY